ncbi:MAG TPA: copper homeostasis periplasmic binding protein CopC [Pseudolabrys sp.]|nr:copper homeostasis periplasmic binding protein CopC [Pseudolabrys sp.]
MRILITTVTAFLLVAEVAFAHAHLDHASPAAGSTVAQAPKEIVLTFTNELEPAFSGAEVTSEKGDLQSGKASVDGSNPAQLRVPLKTLSAGTYKVNWHIMSVDTHRTEGNFTFRVGR